MKRQNVDLRTSKKVHEVRTSEIVLQLVS